MPYCRCYGPASQDEAIATVKVTCSDEQLGFRLRGEGEDGRQAQDFIDIFLNSLGLDTHVFQAGTAGDEAKASHQASFLKHFGNLRHLLFLKEATHLLAPMPAYSGGKSSISIFLRRAF